MTPGVRITFDGRDITARLVPAADGKPARLTNGLVFITVSDEAGSKSDTVEFEIIDPDKHKAPAKGAEVKVWLGWEPQPVYMGLYTVESWSKHGPHRHMRVTAKAAELTTSIRAPKARSHHGLTLGEIAAKIAGEHGLAPVVDAGLEGLTIPHIDQQHESDLAFVNRLAGRVGAVLKVANGSLLVTRKASRTLPSGKPKPGISLRPEEVEDWEFISHARGEYDGVSCAYRDDGAGERRHVHVGVTGGKGHPTHRDRRLYGSRAEAEAAAKAQLEDFKRGRSTCQINAPGRPDAFAEGLCTLSGFDPDVDGVMRIRSVKHSLNAGGFKTSLSLESGQEEETTTSEADEGD